jgi:hypothetical protein
MKPMTSRERVRAAIEHRQPDRVPVDFGSTFITGIHCSVVAGLRDHYGLEKRPVKVCEPYQMLGLVEDDLLDALGVDVVSIFPRYTIFGFPNENWKMWRAPWGQECWFPGISAPSRTTAGPSSIRRATPRAPPSGHMPVTGYFFDTIIRQEPLDEDRLDPADNLEEFKVMSGEDLEYWRAEAARLRGGKRAVITHLNGTCLGDIALVPAPFLTHPKGIRDVAEWYMATAVHQDYVDEVFARQVGIALKNLELLHGRWATCSTWWSSAAPTSAPRNRVSAPPPPTTGCGCRTIKR